MVGYKNGASVLTDATGAFSIQSGNFYTIGHNELGTGPQSNQNQFAEASIGSGFSGTDATNFYNRLRTYMTAVGVP